MEIEATTGEKERVLVEVEILDARGLDDSDDGASSGEEEIWVSMQIVSESDLNSASPEQTYNSRLTAGSSWYCKGAIEAASRVGTAEIQWYRLGLSRRRTFASDGARRDRFLFVATNPAIVRIDVWARRIGRSSSDEARFLGWCQVTPWLETPSPQTDFQYTQIETELAAFRWIRLLTETGYSQQQHKGSGLVARRNSYRSLTGRTSMCKSSSDESTRATVTRRRELRFAATAKICSEDVKEPEAKRADALRWFYRPYSGLRRRRGLEANVLRLACIRADPGHVSCLGAQLVLGNISSENNTVLASKLMTSGEDLLKIVASAGKNCRLTRLQRRGVFTQMLSLELPPKAFQSEDNDDELSTRSLSRTKHTVSKVQKKSKSSVYLELTLFDPENRVVLGTGRIRVAETAQKRRSRPEPEWIEFKSKNRVHLAWRWDYDEKLDPNETRPFFDDELYGCQLAEIKRKERTPPRTPPFSSDKHTMVSTSPNNFSSGSTVNNTTSNPLVLEPDDDYDDPPLLRPVNVLRVVVARARGLFPRLTGSVSTRRSKPVCGATVFHYPKSSAAGETRSTLALTPGRDGSVIWNECFEFALDSTEFSSALSENVRLIIGGGDEFPPAELSVEAPRHRVKRKWYAMSSGGQILVIAGRFQDDHLEANDVRDLAVDQLAMAFPDMNRGVLERVYESCDRRLQESCVALGSLEAAPSTSGIDDKEILEAHLAASNATDLDWIMSPLIGQSSSYVTRQRPLAPSSLSSVESCSSSENEDAAYSSGGVGDDEEYFNLLGSPRRRRRSSFRFSSSAISSSAQRTSRSLSNMLGRQQHTAPTASRLELTAEAKSTMEDEDAVALKRASLLQDKVPKLIRCSAPASKINDAEAVELLTSAALAKLEMVFIFQGNKAGLAPARFRPAFSSGLSPREIETGNSPSAQRRRGRSHRLVVRIRTGCPEIVSAVSSEEKISLDDETKIGEETLIQRISSRFDKTGFELAKIEVDVERAPRDFLALRSGLVIKLDNPAISIPALPPWVVRALRIKTKTRTASLAAGIATASIAAAVAVATGVVPVLAISGGIALGAVALTGASRKSAKSFRQKLDADLARCTFLQDLQKSLLLAELGGNCQRHKLDDAFAFLKLFLTHGGKSRVYQRAKRRDVGDSGPEDLTLDTFSYEETKESAPPSDTVSTQQTQVETDIKNSLEDSEDDGFIIEPPDAPMLIQNPQSAVNLLDDWRDSGSQRPPLPPPDYLKPSGDLARPTRPAPPPPTEPAPATTSIQPHNNIVPAPATNMKLGTHRRPNRAAPLPPPGHPVLASPVRAAANRSFKSSKPPAPGAAMIPHLE